MPSSHVRRRQSGFSIHELLIVIVLVVFTLSLNLPLADAAARRTARRMQNSTQLRGIHQGLVVFANSNKNKFAGLDSRGNIIANGEETTGNSGDGDTVEARYWILISGDYFTPEYAISPSEVALVTEVDYDWQNDKAPDAVKWNDNMKNYSYAMLGIKGTVGQAPDAVGRGGEWSQTLSSQAVVLSDRNTCTNATTQVQSIHTDDRGEWIGSVLWNDNHVAFENSQYFETKFANGQRHGDEFGRGLDNLFAEDRDPDGRAGYDALMVIAGDDTVHGGE